MTPIEASNKVKAAILDVVQALNDAGKLGVKIECNLGVDAEGQAILARFHAWQEMRLEQ